MNSKLLEKQLDAALEVAFRDSSNFCEWFLSRTKFAKARAKYHWSRSDNPWGRIPWKIVNEETGTEESQVRESETDVLVVFEKESGSRFALHIENKIDSCFTNLQPEMYPVRAAHWLNDPKYHNYSDFQTVLIAPQEYYDRYKRDCSKFDVYVSYENISDMLEVFRR